MKTKFYRHLLTLSATAMACAAILAMNPNPATPFPVSWENDRPIADVSSEGTGCHDSKPGISPLGDSFPDTRHND